MTKEQRDAYNNFRESALQVAEAMVQKNNKQLRNEKHRNKMVLAIFNAFMGKQDQQLTATADGVTFEFPLILRDVTWNM